MGRKWLICCRFVQSSVILLLHNACSLAMRRGVCVCCTIVQPLESTLPQNCLFQARHLVCYPWWGIGPPASSCGEDVQVVVKYMLIYIGSLDISAVLIYPLSWNLPDIYDQYFQAVDDADERDDDQLSPHCWAQPQGLQADTAGQKRSPEREPRNCWRWSCLQVSRPTCPWKGTLPKTTKSHMIL